MSNISLGGSALAFNPSDITLLRPDRFSAFTLTYAGVEFFSWGTSVIGKRIELSWDFLEAAHFDTLDTLFQSDSLAVFDPQDGSAHTYNVQILSLEGKYYEGVTIHRKDVRLVLLIMSQAS